MPQTMLDRNGNPLSLGGEEELDPNDPRSFLRPWRMPAPPPPSAAPPGGPPMAAGPPPGDPTVLNTVPPGIPPAMDIPSRSMVPPGGDQGIPPGPPPRTVLNTGALPSGPTGAEMTALESGETTPPSTGIQPRRPMPRTERMLSEVDRLSAQKPPSKLRQVIGGIMQGSPTLRRAGQMVTGEASRQQDLERLKLQEYGANEEQQLATHDDNMRLRQTQIDTSHADRAAAIAARLASIKAAVTPQERYKQALEVGADDDTARKYALGWKPPETTTTVSERPIEQPGGGIAAVSLTTTRTKGSPTPTPAAPTGGQVPPPASTPAPPSQATPPVAEGINIPQYAPGQPGKPQLASINNNPGNLEFRGQPGAVAGDGGRFAKFQTPQAGYDALIGQIKLDAGRGMTLGDYITKFAPPGGKDNNNTAVYIQNAAKALGVDPKTPLAQLDPTKVAQFQVKQESSSSVEAPTGPAPRTIGEPQAPQTPIAGRPIGQRSGTGNMNTVPGLAPGDPSQTGEGARATGEAFLKLLPPGTQAQIHGIMSGAITLPPVSNRGVAVPLRDAVFRADPGFNEQRAQLRKAFASGPEGRNIGALNTATVHLDQLHEAALAMKNGSFRPGNAIYNWVAEKFGSDKVTDYKYIMNALAGETASALKGNATDPEIAHVLGTLGSDMSPDQALGVAKAGLHVMGAKLTTYAERYSQQNPDDKTWSPVLPSAKDVFTKYGVGLPGKRQEGGGGGGQVGGGQVAPIQQRSKSTGAMRHSLDGGRTWQPGPLTR